VCFAATGGGGGGLVEEASPLPQLRGKEEWEEASPLPQLRGKEEWEPLSERSSYWESEREQERR
jgi:hypothetical protein